MEPASSRGLPVWLLLLGTLGAIIGFCWSEQDYVAATALAATAIAGLWGFYVGALRLVGFVGGLAGVYAFASPVGLWLSPYIARGFDTSPGATRLISLVAASGAIFLLTTVAVSIFSNRLLRNRPQLEDANRLLGFGIGGLQGAAAVLLLLSGILVVEPHAKQRVNAAGKGDQNALARAVSKRVVDIAERTRRSTIGSFVVAYNPFEKLPQLKNLQSAVAVLSDPAKLQKAMRSRPAGRLRSKSEVRHAIESLAQDPQLRKLAESGKPLDKQTALSLLNHPGIAKLLEQPDLMRQLSEALSDLDPQSVNKSTR